MCTCVCGCVRVCVHVQDQEHPYMHWFKLVTKHLPPGSLRTRPPGMATLGNVGEAQPLLCGRGFVSTDVEK